VLFWREDTDLRESPLRVAVALTGLTLTDVFREEALFLLAFTREIGFEVPRGADFAAIARLAFGRALSADRRFKEAPAVGRRPPDLDVDLRRPLVTALLITCKSN
jgi:hypothetical protein